MIRLLVALCLIAAPAWAHKLNVFAFVEAEMIVVEAKFSTGKLPKKGVVRVYDAEETLLSSHDLGADGITRLPVDPASAAGLTIEVEVSEGHTDFWILTPDDISGGGG